MASQDINLVYVQDSRIKDITPELTYGVEGGAASNTYQNFNAVSTSKSNIVFNVQVPSESIIVSREVLVRSTIDFTVNITNVPVGKTAFNYGVTDSLQAFPFNSLCSTLSAQINNTNVSVNLQDVMPSLLRMNDSRHLYRYNGMTPNYPDSGYKLFSDAVLANNNPLGGFNNASYDIDQLPRGAYPITKIGNVVHNITAGGTDQSVVSTNTADSWVIELQATVTEPLFLSPFIFGDSPFNKQGFVGLNALNVVCNMDTTCKRFFSTANSGYTYSVSLGNSNNTDGFSKDTALLMNFLSSQDTDLIQAKNVVPYHDFNRYLTSTSSAVNAGSSSSVISQNIQLNQLPDLFLISVRKPMNSLSVKDSNSFLPISKISVNLNNVSGLLSSAQRQDLWRISINNGSTQNWEEFSGYAYRPNVSTGVGQTVPTTGSLLVLNPARDLSLPSYLSCGSIGQFNFQITVDYENNHPTDPITPELCIICVNSGIFSTVAGTSSIYTGILSKQMVLEAKAQPAEYSISSSEYYRQVGGALLPKSAMKEVVRMTLDEMDDGKKGGAKSAGAFSAAGMNKMDSLVM